MGKKKERPIGDKVIAGLLVAAIVAACGWLWRSRTEVSAYLGPPTSWLLHGTVKIPSWVFVLLLVAVLVLILIGAVFIVAMFAHDENQEASWRLYTRDQFFGVNWEWSYTTAGEIANLWCRCPQDETALIYGTSYGGIVTEFKCETCGTKFAPPGDGGDKGQILGLIERQIDRKIKTGAWKRQPPN
jgi:hypothetical protein